MKLGVLYFCHIQGASSKFYIPYIKDIAITTTCCIFTVSAVYVIKEQIPLASISNEQEHQVPLLEEVKVPSLKPLILSNVINISIPPTGKVQSGQAQTQTPPKENIYKDAGSMTDIPHEQEDHKTITIRSRKSSGRFRALVTSADIRNLDGVKSEISKEEGRDEFVIFPPMEELEDKIKDLNIYIKYLEARINDLKKHNNKKRIHINNLKKKFAILIKGHKLDLSKITSKHHLLQQTCKQLKEGCINLHKIKEENIKLSSTVYNLEEQMKQHEENYHYDMEALKRSYEKQLYDQRMQYERQIEEQREFYEGHMFKTKEECQLMCTQYYEENLTGDNARKELAKLYGDKEEEINELKEVILIIQAEKDNILLENEELKEKIKNYNDKIVI